MKTITVGNLIRSGWPDLDKPLIVSKYNKPVAVIVPLGELSSLPSIEEIAQAAVKSVKEWEKDGGK